MTSIFRMDKWRNFRSMLNPSKFKEHQLHATGFGKLNAINPITEYQERFTHIDPLNLKNSNQSRTRLFIQRVGELNAVEQQQLNEYGYRGVGVWGTLVVDLWGPLYEQLNKGTKYDIRRGEGLVFDRIIKEDGWETALKDYYKLLWTSRKQDGLGVQEYKEFHRIFQKLGNDCYDIFLARDPVDGMIYAAIALIHGGNYAFQGQLARRKDIPFASTWLTYTLMCHLKEQGYRWFDLVGVNPQPIEGSKDAGIHAFKGKWMGQYQNVFEFVNRT